MSVTVTQELTQQTVTVTGNPVENNVTVTVSNARGPAGTGGGSNSVTSATTSDGTANLSLAAATVSGTLTAPTAATTTSTTQVATTAFVQQELASGVAVAKNLEFLAHNGSDATMAKGSIVYINGAVGGVPRINKAQGNNDTNSARTIGLVKADIAEGENGFVIIEGELQNVSTADSSGIIGAGIQLYLSPTIPGAFTRTKPSAPNHLVYVGVVVTASTGANLDGKILVGIQNGYELNEIHDVSISAPVAAGQVIKRNAGNTLWINSAIVSADVSDATDAATANTLVRRDANGAAQFVELTVTGGTTFGEESLVQFDAVEYYYGTGAASAHRFALNGGAATGEALFTAATPAAARSQLGIRRFVKASNTDRTNTSTASADDELTGISVVSGATYRMRARLNCYYFAGSTGGVKFTITGTPVAFNSLNGYGWVNYWATSTLIGVAVTSSAIVILNVSGSPIDSQSTILAEITFRAAATSTIALSWAQNSAVSGATLRLLPGSMMSIEEL